ncbi:sensor histidine kinase [Winogradskyella sp. A3E31]|uniref:sensor histidine kinase n=1 Tax=Winogradskyella sp. A3E31 TaxID=3349637 RepID=UPI00398AD442
MNAQRYRWMLYFIVLVIIGTISIQIYWNYKNYLSNKQQLINDVQTSLDKAVDDYYAGLATKTTLGFSLEGDQQKAIFDENSELTKILENIDENSGSFKGLDSLKIEQMEGVTIFKGMSADSMMKAHNEQNKPISSDSFKTKIHALKLKDSIAFSDAKFELLTSKVLVSITNDTLDLNKIDSLVAIELQRKNIDIGYKLKFFESFPKIDGIDGEIWVQQNAPIKNDSIRTFSNSTLLPKKSALKIQFANENKVVLKRILGGILISTLLVLAVISCLFYLLKIIKEQKQLAEIKNDLISNITHEFKTPIATIGVALESLRNFNALEDKSKTKNYLDMSSNQLNKLSVMVEKLLETATLDSENLNLKRETVDIGILMETLVNRYKLQYPERTIESSFKGDAIPINVDVFHFENALNNILDNAIKYGGNTIWLDISPKQNTVDITISDSGNVLSKANTERIFEKFYRVPKGNTHDVKGFGIGLYYTKAIIEKHGGKITLDVSKNLTSFKISIPNV